jgi:hypothetical protein
MSPHEQIHRATLIQKEKEARQVGTLLERQTPEDNIDASNNNQAVEPAPFVDFFKPEQPVGPSVSPEEVSIPENGISDTEVDQRIQPLEDIFNGEENVSSSDAPHSELGKTAIHLDQEVSAPQTIEVHVHPDSIPEEVVAEVASTLKRADFVKQQEDLWGANDEIKAEDVPEGEMTYEEYLAQRPSAESGDSYHHNGRVYNAAPGGPTSDKKAIYEAKLENSSADEHYEKLEAQAAIPEASKENETKDSIYDTIIRTNVEGEFLVQNDVRLRGLLSLAEEVLALHNSKATGEDFEKNVKPVLEEKQANYDALYEYYQEKGLDSRALNFIADKTGSLEDPDFIPVKGSPYLNGEKVDILDFTETPDGKKAYTIEKADGSIEAVYTDEVTFQREFDAYEARDEDALDEETPAEQAPVEPELSRLEKIKQTSGKELSKLLEFGGLAYIGDLWSKPGNWLTQRRIDKGMSSDEIEAQKNRNRRNGLLGLGAIIVVGVAGAVAQRYGVDLNTDMFANLSPDTLDTSAATEAASPILEGEIGHADGAGDIDPSTLTMNSGDLGPEAVNIENPAYNIPEGGTGLGLFHDLGFSDDQWRQHADELANRFPQSFYREGSDVRLVNSGTLPVEVRQAIEAFRNS